MFTILDFTFGEVSFKKVKYTANFLKLILYTRNHNSSSVKTAIH